MNSFKLKFEVWLSNDFKPLYMIFASLVGYLIGIILSYNISYVFSSIDYISVFAKPSVICLLFINLIPIITVYTLLISSMRQLCYPLVFFDCVCSSCCRTGLFYLFGSSSWLIRFFLMFSHSVAMVFCWVLLLCYSKTCRSDLRKKFYLFFAFIFAFTIVDVYLIAPVLSDVNFIL